MYSKHGHIGIHTTYLRHMYIHNEWMAWQYLTCVSQILQQYTLHTLLIACLGLRELAVSASVCSYLRTKGFILRFEQYPPLHNQCVVSFL